MSMSRTHKTTEMLVVFKIKIVDKQLDELGVAQHGEPQPLAIDLLRIESAWPSRDSDTEDALTVITMRSGDQFHVYHQFSDVIAMWLQATEKTLLTCP